MDLVVSCYEVASALPAEERFALASQIRRSAVSIPSNIAEGFGRHHTTDFIRFLRIAQGSTKELETQLLITVRVGYTTDHMIADHLSMLDRVGRMLHALIRSLADRAS